MSIQKKIEEVETTEHELYISVGLYDPVNPSVFNECINNILSNNIRVKSWGVHTKDEYIGIIDEQQSIISQQAEEIKRLKGIIEKCLIGGNSLASILIGFDLPKGWHDWTYEEASKNIYAHYPLDQDIAYQRYEIWLCWKTLKEQGQALEGESPC